MTSRAEKYSALSKERRKRVDKARANLARAESLLMEAQALQMEQADAEPTEPERGSIIKFDVQFKEDGPVYTYVAWRGVMNGWYLTNRAGSLPWSEVQRVMLKDVTAKRFGIRFYCYPPDGSPGKWRGRKR